MNKDDVIAAVAQGWCSPENSHKTMDSVLAHAIVDNIMGIEQSKITIEQAMNTLRKAMTDDVPSELGSYAHSWHCNIAMACYDCMVGHGIDHDALHTASNDAASRFMAMCFDVETSNGERNG